MTRERFFSRGETIGPYVVERVLATGGMGIVYEAKPDSSRRADLLRLGVDRVAIKVMRLDESSLTRYERKQLVERMDREFNTLFKLTRLGHPNVVKVYDFGREEGVPYYAMEFVEGVTLGEAMDQQPRMGQMMNVFGKLCGAVAFLHEGGICHRDLKPSNVLLRCEDGSPVLIDFGICLPPGERTLTSVSDLLGTPQYLSPEYAAHWMDPATVRPYVAAPTDDVWALGVMLYEILTGRTPWRNPPDRREALLREILEVTPPHPSEVYRKAPRLLGDVAMQLLERDFQKRPPNASAVLHLLGPAAEASDVLGRIPARRPPPRTKKTSWDGALVRKVTPVAREERRQPPPPEARRDFRLTELAAFAALVVLLLVGLWIHDSRLHAAMESQLVVSAPTLPMPSVPVGGHGQDLEPALHLPKWSYLPGPITPVALYGSVIWDWQVRLVLADLPMPNGPLQFQARPPCAPGEYEINGGCWSQTWVIRRGGKCPAREFRYKLACYRPVRDPKFPLDTPPSAQKEKWLERP